MKKNWVINGVLALVVLGLGLFASQRKDAEPTPQTALLPNLHADAITRIQLHKNGNLACELAKENAVWHLVKPLTAAVNDYQVQQLLSLPAQPIRKSLDSKQPLQNFGLAEPSLVLTLDQHRIAFGASHPINHQRYLHTETGISLVDDRWQQILNACPESLISPQLIDSNRKITRIRLPDAELWLEQGRWQRNPAVATTESATTESMDVLQTFLDEWRYAQALFITRIDTLMDTRKPKSTAARVEIQFEDGGTVYFLVDAVGDGGTLSAPLRGLVYHMHAESLANLLQAPKVPAAPGT